MNRSVLILGLIGALVAPGLANAVPAQVGSWTRGCQAGSVVRNLEGGSWACYTPAAGASNESATPVLDVSDCENVDLFSWDDFDGDGTVCTVTWDIETCAPGAGSLATDALKNAACTTLPGAAALTADDVESNLAASQLRIHGLAAGVNIDSCRIVVKCAEGAQ